MPNWCSTTITIWDEKEEELANFVKLLDEWTSKDYMENGFGHNWLGNIVLGSKIGTIDTGKSTDIRCRGTVDFYDYSNGRLDIGTETAWEPMLDIWVRLQEKHFPSGYIEFTAEEPGSELFVTNDYNMMDKWIIDSWLDDIEYEFDASEERVIEVIQGLLSTSEKDVNKLLKMLWESNIEDIVIHKWEFTEIENCL